MDYPVELIIIRAVDFYVITSLPRHVFRRTEHNRRGACQQPECLQTLSRRHILSRDLLRRRRRHNSTCGENL